MLDVLIENSCTTFHQSNTFHYHSNSQQMGGGGGGGGGGYSVMLWIFCPGALYSEMLLLEVVVTMIRVLLLT